MADQKLFQQYLDTSDPSRAESLLQSVLASVEPIITRRLGDRLDTLPAMQQRTLNLADLVQGGKKRLALLLRENRTSKVVSSPNKLVFRACDEIWTSSCRRNFPGRMVVEQELRTALLNTTGLEIWTTSDGEELVGFSTWRDKPVLKSSERLTAMRNNPSKVLTEHQLKKPNIVQSVDSVMDYLGGPIPFGTLVSVLTAVQTGTSTTANSLSNAETNGEDIDALWASLKSMPKELSRAMLLAPNDPQFVDQLVAHGVPISELAAAMGETSANFPDTYKRIPLPIEQVAEKMGETSMRVRLFRELARRNMAASRDKWLEAKEAK